MMVQEDEDTLHFRNDARPATTNPTSRVYRSRINMDIFEVRPSQVSHDTHINNFFQAKKILGYQTNVRVGEMTFDDLQKKFIDKMQREKERSQREKERSMNANEVSQRHIAYVAGIQVYLEIWGVGLKIKRSLV